ncbi:MAG: hypothetical protein WAV20_09145 [Blastocatellia bacterium]
MVRGAGFPAADFQNEQVARAYSRWPVDVINLGRDDLMFARKLLAREGLQERIHTVPMIRNLISANLVFGSDAAPPPAYVIKEVAGPRIYGGKKKLRIGFVGLAEPDSPGEGMRDANANNMFAAATPAILKARKECDVLVVIAHCDLEPALKLASENLEVDVVIAANAGGFYKPRRVGNTTVVSAAPGNVQEGDLRLYIDNQGQVTFKFLSTDLDALVPSDPGAAAYVQAARADRDRFK